MWTVCSVISNPLLAIHHRSQVSEKCRKRVTPWFIKCHAVRSSTELLYYRAPCLVRLVHLQYLISGCDRLHTPVHSSIIIRIPYTLLFKNRKYVFCQSHMGHTFLGSTLQRRKDKRWANNVKNIDAQWCYFKIINTRFITWVTIGREGGRGGRQRWREKTKQRDCKNTRKGQNNDSNFGRFLCYAKERVSVQLKMRRPRIRRRTRSRKTEMITITPLDI